MVSCICNSIQNGRKNPMTPSNAVQYLSWSIKREKNNESCLEIGKLENGFIANIFFISRMKDWFILMDTAFNLNAMNLYNIKVNCSFHTTNNLAGFSARFNCTVITQRLPNSLYFTSLSLYCILHGSNGALAVYAESIFLTSKGTFCKKKAFIFISYWCREMFVSESECINHPVKRNAAFCVLFPLRINTSNSTFDR